LQAMDSRFGSIFLLIWPRVSLVFPTSLYVWISCSCIGGPDRGAPLPSISDYN
jgi:hypothetical protein